MKNKPEKPDIIELINRFLEFFKKQLQKIKPQHLAFLFFVALASITWLLRALSDVYVADVEYPVEFINLPPDRILTAAPINTLQLQVKADGYTLLSNRLKSKRTLRYDLNTFKLYTKSKDSTTLFALTSSQKERLTNELNLAKNNMQIVDIDPDTIFFNFTRIRKKKLPVIPVLAKNNNKFASQHMANGEAYTTPDSIEVSGPDFIVDTLQAVLTSRVWFSNLAKDGMTQTALQRIPQVKYSPVRVYVTLPVDEFTESGFDIPIVSINVPDSLSLKTFPRTVKVNFLITHHNYDKVNEETFKAYVDFSAIDPDMNKKLRVELAPVPDYIHNLSIVPRNIDYLIE